MLMELSADSIVSYTPRFIVVYYNYMERWHLEHLSNLPYLITARIGRAAVLLIHAYMGTLLATIR